MDRLKGTFMDRGQKGTFMDRKELLWTERNFYGWTERNFYGQKGTFMG